MLVLTRKIGEAVSLDPDYRIEVLGIEGDTAKLELHASGSGQRRILPLRPEQRLTLPADGMIPGGEIGILCCGIFERKIRLGFDAPREIGIMREEILIERAELEAADREMGDPYP